MKIKNMWTELLHKLITGDVKALARTISLIENGSEGYEEFLKQLPANNEAHVLGITGPPGAGKSTLTDALIKRFVDEGKKVGVICVDPSSPFNYGAILGDRIRMCEWYNNPSVFIRSLATRGSLGGLHPKIIEITDVFRSAGYNEIIIETVGVGQSEVEIAGIADTTIVVLVPESGDEVQNMKAGLMEIADIFVVNKGDRPDADLFIKNLKMMLAPAFHAKVQEIEIIKTAAINQMGINELFEAISNHRMTGRVNDKKIWLLAQKTYSLIQAKRMKEVSIEHIISILQKEYTNPQFNLYRFSESYFQDESET